MRRSRSSVTKPACQRALGRGAVLAVLALALVAGPAGAARLVGGARQAAIHRAFFAHGSHRGQLIVSTRASTIKPAWAVVKSVVPQRAGRTTATARAPKLRSTYYQRVGDAERPGQPPPPARADLTHRFTVDVRYTGSGSEAVTYDQLYGGVCTGLGGFTDAQKDTVAPMRWVVRYEIDPDNLLSAVRGPQGPTLVPRVRFLTAGSSLTARQTMTRTAVDLSCAGKPTRFRCTIAYRLSPGTGLLSFPPGDGLEIGVPMTSKGAGQCAAVDYTLGPSLFDSGATTALIGSLGIAGGTLATDPYKPISVQWPTDSAQQTEGFVASPCQGDGPACSDAFTWHGVVALTPAAGG